MDHDVNTSVSDISNDLKLISYWAFQWKMHFDPGPRKKAQKIIVCIKKEIMPPKSVFQHTNILKCYSESYKYRLEFVLPEVKKTMGLFCKFQ